MERSQILIGIFHHQHVNVNELSNDFIYHYKIFQRLSAFLITLKLKTEKVTAPITTVSVVSASSYVITTLFLRDLIPDSAKITLMELQVGLLNLQLVKVISRFDLIFYLHLENFFSSTVLSSFKSSRKWSNELVF